MNAAEIKSRLCDMARLAYANRMVAGSGGNVSVRDGERIFITPSGCCLGDVTPGDLIEVSSDEKAPIPATASMETVMHRRVYAVRPQDFAILHLHTYYTVLAGLTNDASCRMPAYTPGYVLALGELPIVGFAPPGSVVLARGRCCRTKGAGHPSAKPRRGGVGRNTAQSHEPYRRTGIQRPLAPRDERRQGAVSAAAAGNSGKHVCAGYQKDLTTTKGGKWLGRRYVPSPGKTPACLECDDTRTKAGHRTAFGRGTLPERHLHPRRRSQLRRSRPA